MFSNSCGNSFKPTPIDFSYRKTCFKRKMCDWQASQFLPVPPPSVVPLLGALNLQRPASLRSLVQCVLHDRMLRFLPPSLQTLATSSPYPVTVEIYLCYTAVCLRSTQRTWVAACMWAGMLLAGYCLIWCFLGPERTLHVSDLLRPFLPNDRRTPAYYDYIVTISIPAYFPVPAQ